MPGRWSCNRTPMQVQLFFVFLTNACKNYHFDWIFWNFLLFSTISIIPIQVLYQNLFNVYLLTNDHSQATSKENEGKH